MGCASRPRRANPRQGGLQNYPSDYEGNLRFKGAGKRNFDKGYTERSAVARAAAAGDVTLRSTDSSARSSMDPNPSFTVIL